MVRRSRSGESTRFYVDVLGFQRNFGDGSDGWSFLSRHAFKVMLGECPDEKPASAFFDLFPVSVLTTSTLDELNAGWPQSRFDERRFRMKVNVRTGNRGFLENDWVGRQLGVGPAVRLNVSLPDPRCVMTTLAQEDLPRDTDILRALTRHNRIHGGAAGRFPCAGVYAVLAAPGTARTGDRVDLL